MKSFMFEAWTSDKVQGVARPAGDSRSSALEYLGDKEVTCVGPLCQ